MSPQAVTVRLQRLSQLRVLCLSLAAAGRRAGLAPHPSASTPEPEASQQRAEHHTVRTALDPSNPLA